MELVELLVRIDCSGCERKVRKQLSKLRGVDSIEIDARMSKVIVIGYVDRRKVLKAVRKTGKKAEFWQEAFTSRTFNTHPYNSNDDSSYHSHGYYSFYNRPSSSYICNHVLPHNAFKRSYNYEKHGYNHYSYSNETEISSPLFSHGHHEQASTFFSDENPNSCSIM